MKLHYLVSFSLLFIPSLPACSSASPDSGGSDAGAASDANKDSGGDAPADASSDATGSPDTSAPSSPATDAAEDAALACNVLVNSAAVVTVEQVASNPPAPEGGTIVDGIYAMTSAIIYTGPNGPSGATGTGQTTLQVEGNTIQVATTGQPPALTVSFTTGGTNINAVNTCPDTDPRPATYTATPTSLVIQLPGGTDDAGARTVVETYTKQ